MQQGMQIESGLHLLARLGTRPSLEGLDSVLFSEGPRHKEIAEICGNLSSGKTLLITQLLAKCLLPLGHKGLGAGAIFINTDHHFQITKLADIMLSRIDRWYVSKKQAPPSREELDAMVKSCLDNLIVINCSDSSQFSLALHSMETFLSRDEKIAFIAIDSISAYYWQDQECGGIRMMNLYLKNIIQMIQRHTLAFKVFIVYSKPDCFGSERTARVTELAREKINYRIQLCRKGDLEGFSATIESLVYKKNVDYLIDAHGIRWIV